MLANEQSLWKSLCQSNGWQWRHSLRSKPFETTIRRWRQPDSDDEGMGGSDEEADDDEMTANMDYDHHPDSGFFSFTGDDTATPMPVAGLSHSRPNFHDARPQKRLLRHSAPPILTSPSSGSAARPDYKVLHQTHVRLRKRFLNASYRLSALQTRGAQADAHTNTIYCLQLYIYPTTGNQVLFTGSRDKTVREWNIETGVVERVISGVHSSSILSICVHNGILASAGSDRRLALWDLEKNTLIKLIDDHEDSVLCVRFDETRVASCSKGMFDQLDVRGPDVSQIELLEHIGSLHSHRNMF